MALATAKAASERLTRQLLTIGETAAAIEERIAEDRAEREEREARELSRRVALIIDALNSTAIDVSKILSNEVSDAAWAAYLKGDRGAFTRRAVRLLESGEAREILRHYEEEPEFRDQVNRYIADFETMLRARARRAPAAIALGITLLSSDMGKLYVALAQAIERLQEMIYAVQPVEVARARDPAERCNWRRKGRSGPRRRCGAERHPAEVEAVRRAFGMAGPAFVPSSSGVRTPKGRTRNRASVQNRM